MLSHKLWAIMVGFEPKVESFSNYGILKGFPVMPV